MKKIKSLILPVLAFVMMCVFVFGATTVKAEGESGDGSHMYGEGDIALVPGFYCLHPHKKTPTPYDPVHMIAKPSTEYTGYSQDILKQVAAAVILRGEYYRETEKSIDGGDLQAVIWAIVCDHPNGFGSGNLHLNDRPTATEYYNYVMSNYSSLSEDDYTMTIWVSTKDDYQDILEARLVEKHGVPSVEKKLEDTNDTDNTGDAATGWQDSADYDIGDTIPFQITATLRDMPNFQNYYLEFKDHMEHMTIVQGSIKVEIDGKDVTDSFTITQTTTEDKSKTDLSIKCDNILPFGAANGSHVVVTYSATLNEDAVVGTEGNPNDVYLVYTRSSGTADKGETPKDRVKVFTYLMTVDKVDSEGKELDGAAFKLSKKQSDGTYKTVAVIGATENADGSYTLNDSDKDGKHITHFEWKGIDDGTYKLEEVVTPTGYNTIEPIEFWVKASHDPSAEDPLLHYVNSNYAGFDGFLPAEALQYTEEYSSIKNPEGYYGVHTGELDTEITNVSGAILPSTGGTGTKLFYILGSMFVLAAGVLLVARKRVHA